jgi:hypothetical protein
MFFQETSSARPALGVLRGEVFVAWADADNRLNLMRAMGDGSDKVPLEETSFGGPSLADLNDELFIAWTDGNQRLNVMRAFGDHSDKQTLDQTSIAGPALYRAGDSLHIAWTGTDGAGLINTMPVTDSSRKRTLPPEVTSDFGPAIGLGQAGDGYFVFTRKDRKIAWYPISGDPSILQGNLGNNFSIAGSALSNNGQIAWAGTDGDHKLNVMPLRGNEPQHRVFGDQSIFGPALFGPANFGILIMAWTGTDGAHRLNVREID